MAIGRALARCGSKKGYQILIDYLDDVRSLLSKQAHTELNRLSGLDLKKDKESWSGWLEKTKGSITPQSYIYQTDLAEEEDEMILRKVIS